VNRAAGWQDEGDSKINDRRPWRGDPYWQYEMTLILLDFGANALPELSSTEDASGNQLLVASRVRLKYVVRRIAALRKEYVGRLLAEKVHDFLDLARLQRSSAYWLETDQEFHTRGVFML
jgi:hypothetical protein